MPTSVFIDILSGILIIIGIICLLTAFKKRFSPDEVDGKKVSVIWKSKKIHLVLAGFFLLLLGACLMLLN